MYKYQQRAPGHNRIKDEDEIMAETKINMESLNTIGESYLEDQEKDVKSGSCCPLFTVVKARVAQFSMHGTGNIMRAGTSKRRVSWLIVVCICLGVLIAQCFSLISTYLLYRTSLTPGKELADAAPFPSVTVCNLNPYRMSQVTGPLQAINTKAWLNRPTTTTTTTTTTTEAPTTTTTSPPQIFVEEKILLPQKPLFLHPHPDLVIFENGTIIDVQVAIVCPPGSVYTNEECLCAPGTQYHYQTNTCKCPSPSVWNGSISWCVCPDERHFNLGKMQCECFPPQMWNSTTETCEFLSFGLILDLPEFNYISLHGLVTDNGQDNNVGVVEDIFPVIPFEIKIPTTELQARFYATDALLAQLREWRDRKEGVRYALLNYLNEIHDSPNANEKKLSMGHAVDKMIFGCRFQGKFCSWRNFSTFHSDIYGNCFTFEPEKEIEIGRREASPEYGLHLNLYTEPGEYLQHYTESKGFRITLHDKEKPPLPASRGFTISPGKEVDVGVNLVRTEREEAPYDTKCEVLAEKEQIKADLYYDFYGGDENVTTQNISVTSDKRVITGYTQEGCLTTCYQQQILKTCGCVFAGSPMTNLAPYDGEMPKICPYLNNSLLPCYQDVVSSFREGDTHCHCPPLCRESDYVVVTRGEGDWPSEGYLVDVWGQLMEHLPNLAIHSANEVMKSTSKLIIHLVSTDIETHIHYPDLDLPTILSNLGGSVGMYLGVSVIALCELIELILDLTFYPKKQDQKDEDQKGQDHGDHNIGRGKRRLSLFGVGKQTSPSEISAPTEALASQETHNPTEAVSSD